MDITLIVITLLAIAVAATMSIVAWRVIAGERRRSDARVAALAAEVRSDDLSVAAPPEPLDHMRGDVMPGEIFAAPHSAPSRSRFGVAAVAGVVVVTTATILAIIFSARPGTAPVRAASGSTSASSHAGIAPLELMALSHERTADRITIHGIVRNPAGAAATPHLTAVVLLFSTEGSFIASARADVNQGRLEPGAEGTFVVTVPGATDVSRYRVSFKSDDHVVPHLDRREGAAS